MAFECSSRQTMDSRNTSASHLFYNIKRGRYTFVLALGFSSAIDKLNAVCDSFSAPTFPVPRDCQLLNEERHVRCLLLSPAAFDFIVIW